MKKVVTIGGGTGQSALLRGLKKYPLKISAVVSVCDDGKSTGRLREEFNTFAVGDIRKVLVALSETEPLLKDLLSYRFKTTGALNGHVVGNFLLTALCNITDNIQDGIDTISKVLNVKGEILPFTFDRHFIIGKMQNGSFVRGEHNITMSSQKIDSIHYEHDVKVNDKVLQAIADADLIILTMGSLYTSIIPNLLSPQMINALDQSKAKIMYICNMMSQVGETDDLKVGDYVNILNSYLGQKKIEILIANTGDISPEMLAKYANPKRKDKVIFDEYNLTHLKLITDNYVTIEDEMIGYQIDQLAKAIYNYLLESGE